MVTCADCDKPRVRGHVRCRYHLDATNKQTREYLAQRRAEGRCNTAGCGNMPAPNRIRCVRCLKVASAGSSRRYAERRAKKRCCDCNKPADKTRCRPCQKRVDTYLRLYKKKQAKERKAAGLCIQCARKAVKNRTHCRLHLTVFKEKARVLRYRALKTGVCYRCSRPARPGRQLCQFHNDLHCANNKKRRHRAAKLGICWRCKWPAIPGRQLCQFHMDAHAQRVKESRNVKQ